MLTAADVRCLVATIGFDRVMDEVIDAVRTALLDQEVAGNEVRARDGFLIGEPATGCVEWMPHHRVGESVTVKVVSYVPDNAVRSGLPTILGTIGRWDGRTGQLQALADGTILTALRTGAASAIASGCLAAPGSSVLGIIGAGAQAVTQVHALARVLPIETVLVSDIDPCAARTLARRVAPFCRATVEVASTEAIGQHAEVICTATSVAPGGGPVLSGWATDRRIHLNAIGADLPGKWELPLDLLRNALVVPDLLIQAVVEGECQRLIAQEIGPELGHVLLHPGHIELHGPTVFDSTGTALEDHAALDVLMKLAEEAGIGSRLQLEHRPVDVLDPYSIGATRRSGGEARSSHG